MLIRELIAKLEAQNNPEGTVFASHENPYGVDDIVVKVETVELIKGRVILTTF